MTGLFCVLLFCVLYATAGCLFTCWLDGEQHGGRRVLRTRPLALVVTVSAWPLWGCFVLGVALASWLANLRA